MLVVVAGGVLAGCASSSGSGAELSGTDVEGEWTQADSKPPVYLELAEDGGLTGSDGCNQLTGSWEVDGTEVDFGDLARDDDGVRGRRHLALRCRVGDRRR